MERYFIDGTLRFAHNKNRLSFWGLRTNRQFKDDYECHKPSPRLDNCRSFEFLGKRRGHDH